MRPSLSSRFLEKAEAALIAGIEIYNKPAFAYREETFALLVLNAWELLLKARILTENNNDPTSIYEYEKRQTRKGPQSRKLYLKRNRSRNPQTISLGKAVVTLDKSDKTRLDQSINQGKSGCAYRDSR